MEITLLLGGAAAFVCWIWTSWIITFFIGFSIALCYGRWYWDGSEYDGRKEWPAFRKLRLWSVLHRYFSHEIRFLGNSAVAFRKLRDEGRPCMFAVHPHGLFCVSGPVGFGLHGGRTDDMPKLYIAVSSAVFFFPVLRELFLWMGAVDVGRATVGKMLDEKKFVGLAPGGVRAMILSKPGSLDLYVGHEGFLKICYDRKVPLAPAFAMGENDVFSTFTTPSLSKVRSWCVAVLGYPLPSFFVGPRRAKLTTYCCEPIEPSEYDDYPLFKEAYYRVLFETIRDSLAEELTSEKLRNEMERLLG